MTKVDWKELSREIDDKKVWNKDLYKKKKHDFAFAEPRVLYNDGSYVDGTNVPLDRYALDIGEKTIEQNKEVIREFIEKNKEHASNLPVFHNGVFGVFEKVEFGKGTKAWAE